MKDYEILACAMVLIPATFITFLLLKTGILDSLSGATGCLGRLIILALVFGILCLLTMFIIAKIA